MQRNKSYDQFENVKKTAKITDPKPVRSTQVRGAALALGHGVKSSDVAKGYCSKPMPKQGREKTDDGHERARAG